MADLPRPSPERINAALTAEGDTYLHELCKRKAPVAMIVEAVRDLGAMPDMPNKHGLPPLALAIAGGYGEAVAALCDLGASVVVGQFNGVLYAVDAVRSEMLALVLRAGRGQGVNAGGLLVDNAVTAQTPLMLAAARLQPQFTEMLLAAGALVDLARADDGMTAVHLAAGRKDPAVLVRLLDAGGRATTVDREGKTPLHEAAGYGCGENISLLLAAGGDGDATDHAGTTALHAAVLKKQAEAAKVLLAAGVKVDARLTGMDNETALMLAARRGYEELVIELLVAGADALAANDGGQTAAAMVSKQTHAELSSFLEGEEVFRLQRHFERAYKDEVARKAAPSGGTCSGQGPRPPSSGMGKGT